MKPFIEYIEGAFYLTLSDTFVYAGKVIHNVTRISEDEANLLESIGYGVRSGSHF